MPRFFFPGNYLVMFIKQACYNSSVISIKNLREILLQHGVSGYRSYCFVIVKSLLFSILAFCHLHSFSQPFHRIISLAPSITEVIYSLDAQKQLAGCTSFCTPAVADGVQIVGSAVEVNVEKTLSLKPDLVLAMQLTKEQDLQALRKLGINVILVPTPKNFDEICKQTIEIGKLTGKESNALRITTKAELAVDSLSQIAHKNRPVQKIFFQLGSNPIFTVLDNTFMNDFILLANSRNIFEGIKKGSVTRESVLAKNPDIIIVATMGGFGKEEKKVWEGYKNLKAATDKKIFLISSETSCTPTPESFVSAFTDVIKFVTN